jgi:hypothetical protein
MQILFDEMMPRPLRKELLGHAVSTIEQARLKGLKNGALAAAEGRFDALLTMDRNFEFTQNVSRSTLRFVIIHAINNRVAVLRPLVPDILLALNHAQPGQVVHVPRDWR